VLTATEWSKAVTAVEIPEIEVDVVPARAGRPGGRRFGTLVHAVLATVPLDSVADDLRAIAGMQARLINAPAVEAEAAAVLAADVLRHPLLRAAARAAATGQACLREVPVAIVRDGVLVDGQADLAFEEVGGWVVVDFKTDAEFALGEAIYRRQVSLYAEAITHATGRPARGVLLRV
jgi:ATP-dependent exoDNAse (exonuclease V) beta subunit